LVHQCASREKGHIVCELDEAVFIVIIVVIVIVVPGGEHNYPSLWQQGWGSRGGGQGLTAAVVARLEADNSQQRWRQQQLRMAVAVVAAAAVDCCGNDLITT
jgi:hypothetical protein